MLALCVRIQRRQVRERAREEDSVGVAERRGLKVVVLLEVGLWLLVGLEGWEAVVLLLIVVVGVVGWRRRVPRW